MRAGLPLSDADRMPWLQRLARIIDEDLHAGRSLVLACSALKEAYRETLRGRNSGQVLFVGAPAVPLPHAHHQNDAYKLKPAGMQVLLLPSHTELARRVAARTLAGLHFMPAVLLQSQLAILETAGPDVLTIEGAEVTRTIEVLFRETWESAMLICDSAGDCTPAESVELILQHLAVAAPG